MANGWSQLQHNKTAALLAAVVVVVGLGAFKASRPYAVPIGVVIMALWIFKWQRQGGRLS